MLDWPSPAHISPNSKKKQQMDNIFSERLISLRELALLTFALLLLAAAPDKAVFTDTSQQPVNVTVPAEEDATAKVNAA